MKQLKHLISSRLILAATSLLLAGAHGRTWTSADGTNTFDGELRSYDPTHYDGTFTTAHDDWISDGLGFCASNQALWKEQFKSSDEELPVSIEHHRNFIDCVKSRQETICPVEMGIRCDTICHMANIAARTGRTVVWNPENEEIVGDPDAAKMLTRPSREKWRVW